MDPRASQVWCRPYHHEPPIMPNHGPHFSVCLRSQDSW